MDVNAAKLRELRQSRALAMRELAESSGVNLNSIYLIENGKQPGAHPKTIRKLAGALGVDPAELMGRDRQAGQRIRELDDTPER